jgi:hypothetical protein
MPEVSPSGLAVVVVLAFTVPLVAGLFPGVRVPGAVLEIVAGIIIGPSVLGWVVVDDPLQVLALIGLAFLLFPASRSISFGCEAGCCAPHWSASRCRSRSRCSLAAVWQRSASCGRRC